MEQETVVTTDLEPQTENVHNPKTDIVRSVVKSSVKKAVEWVKPRWKIESVLLVLLCLFVLYCVGVGIAECRNYYMTPIKATVKLSNTEIHDIEDASLTCLNGLGEKQLKKITKIMHNSDAYMEMIESMEYFTQQDYIARKELYGEDCLMTVTELSRRPLHVYELREHRREIRDIISSIGYIVDESEEYKSTDWREIADELDMTKDQAKELIQAYGKYVDEMEPVKVTEGYEVFLQTTITGELLEEPETDTQQVVVIKLNGRWVMLDMFDSMEIFFEILG